MVERSRQECLELSGSPVIGDLSLWQVAVEDWALGQLSIHIPNINELRIQNGKEE